MSWDQPSCSFGTPNAQPPTPTQTPKSAHFPSPTLLETPRNNTTFENRSGWTPTFAEEYSVFDTTPGRLTGHHRSFVDIAATPQIPSAYTQNRRLSSSAGDAAAELSTHVQLSPDPSIPLPPNEPSNRRPPSPAAYPTKSGRFDDSTKKVTPRKPRKRLEEAFSGQTATPPQTASKGTRKLAPKISTETMQNGSHDSQHDNCGTPTHPPGLLSFPPTSADMFGYPMSAPATAPVFSNGRSFWDPDTNMSGMDLDFSTEDYTGSHRTSDFDWGRDNQMSQNVVNAPSNQNHSAPLKRQRPLAPKAPAPKTDLPTSLSHFDFTSTDKPSVSGDPFSAATLEGGVDPGLLFGRAHMTSGLDDVSLPTTRPATSYIAREPYEHQLRESRRDQEELRRSRSARESSTGRRFERGTVSSPVRSHARPILQRSVSDSRARRSQDRILPRTGRSSPLKLRRLDSLTSIPESPVLKPRTEVVFTIDSKGRARTETVVASETPRPRRGPSSFSRNEEWESSQYESSSDEEPIILPSRSTSFNLPSQPKGPRLARFETSNHATDIRRHSTTGSVYSRSESSSQRSMHLEGVESEAETVVEEDEGSGNATHELRKVMESRKKIKDRNPRHHHYATGTTPRASSMQYVNYGSSTNLSPTTVTDPDGATPSSMRSGATRCVCNNAESEGFMIQCESCDYWLHGQCVNIDQRSLPPVYICAFCAQTPNVRGGRIRDTVRGAAHPGSSPLAHKSFKSLR